MLTIPKEKILERLNTYSREALGRASEFCMEQSGYEITVSHMILAILEQPAGDVSRLLNALNLNAMRLEALARKSIERSKTGAHDLPQFSPMLLELLQDAFVISNGSLQEDDIRTGAIWLAIASNPDRYCHFYIQSEFEAMDADGISAGFHELTKGSMEGPITDDDRSSIAAGPVPEGETALQKYGRDITQQAREGLIDPVFCRESEIALTTDVLCRRRKNNPILVGDPGVGKTALAEGLALKIIDEDVPAALIGAALWELDLGALQAGASVKGEFERRLKGVLDEVLSTPEKIILFIDEAHTLIGGGGQAGGSDAANLLKPALARGQLRVVAATTWSEYKKYFEKDPALTRRFQLIKLDEPSPDQAVTILRGLRSAYEEAHNVYISDAALQGAAHLSDRYLTGRQLPDKAFDVLDTACVRVAAGQTARPRELELLEKRIQMLELQQKDEARDMLMRAEGAVDGSDATDQEIARLQIMADGLRSRWDAEKAKVDRVVFLRSCIARDPDAEPEEDDEPLPDGTREDWQSEVTDLRADLRAARHNNAPLVNFEVGNEAIANVIADWTGVPASAMSDDDAAKVLLLGDRLKSGVRGQDLAIDVIHDRMKAARLDFVRENTPRGTFLLVGPSGVGKTETAEQVAEHLFGGKQFLTVINMSEYQEKHTVSRLIGSPPGYVGYGEGGVLTEEIRRKPYSVVLLDEVEKAHADVMNIFYQAFDKGVLNDGEGREIDCKNIVFFMTSNLGSDALMQNRENVVSASMESLETALRPHLETHFKPALLARMRILCFKPLESDTICMIIDQKLASQAKRLKDVRGLELTWDETVTAQIEDLCAHSDNGARMVEQVIDRWILPPIAEEALQRITREETFEAVEISARDGGFELTFLPENKASETETPEQEAICAE
ncbi:type VI secretion system ATPase TssH [Halocynthiibacter namhaensis]|uniref:type VI secretion system ATPase TssH n=1 Tax=Halocynthiibacter namhaensis TaxID=1290553 RepID=UPI000578FC25|nr:type VI secretion system ATPase TssH [Halocynthiibacter namhaensis]